VAFNGTTGDPVYSPGANVFQIPTNRCQLTIWDDSDVPVEDTDPLHDANFAVMVQAVGYGPNGVATRTITTRLQYGTDKDYAQHEQNSYSNSAADQNVDASGTNSSTTTYSQ